MSDILPGLANLTGGQKQHSQPRGPVKPHVKLYAELSAAAFRGKLLKELAMWHCLRALDENGCGNLFYSTIMELEDALAAFGYSRRTVHYRLFEVKSPFYSVDRYTRHAVVKIYGLLTVCRALNITLAGDKYARLLSIDQFNTIKRHNAQIYASIHKPEGIRANPKTRATITKMTGLSKRQQRRYEVEAKVKRHFNYEDRQDEKGNYQPVMVQVPSKSRFHTVHRKLGNIYHSCQATGRKGQTVKVQRVLRTRRESLIGDVALRVRRCFYASLRQLTKALRGKVNMKPTYYLVRNHQRVKRGRLEWCCETAPAYPIFEV